MAGDRLLAALDLLPVPAFVVDVAADGRCTLRHLNPAHRAATGLSADTDRPMRDLVPAEAFAKVAPRYREAAAGGGPLSYTEHLDLPGGPRWWRTTLRTVPCDVPGVVRLLGIGVDITEPVEGSDAADVRAELEARLRELRRTNAELEQFATVASHDLQAPLRRIITFGDRLAARAGPHLDPRSRRYLDRMQRAAEGASRLVRDLLTFSRAGGVPADRIPVDLDEILDELALVLPSGDLRVHRPARLPAVRADPSLVRRILQNLLLNAAQHAAVDGVADVTVTAWEETPSRGAPCVAVALRDRGPGFPPADAERILAPFVRLDARSPGAGIGLSIAARLAASMGGRLAADAEPGAGAVFTLRLPAARC